MEENNIERYYAKRAAEYEEIYRRDDPLRRAEQAKIVEVMTSRLAGCDILEVACGTGYWTQFLSRAARSICAVDSSCEVLSIAKSKKYDCPIEFMLQDAYNLALRPGTFEGGAANFWFSHIPRQRIDGFLKAFHARLEAGSPVFIADNVYVPGLGGEFVERDGDENTYKLRQIEGGSQHLILKNYYSTDELQKIFLSRVDDFTIVYGQCYWWITYSVI